MASGSLGRELMSEVFHCPRFTRRFARFTPGFGPATALLKLSIDTSHERAAGSVARQKGVELETDIVLGHPAEQIIHKADTIQASLIVMGKRSHSILHRWMLGSNSERVLRNAQCPVMIVH